MVTGLRRIWHPAVYQGGRVAKRYFEGWYFKHVDADRQHAVAVIPGVSYSRDGSERHAFVQVVPGGGSARYYMYDIDEFAPGLGDEFFIRIGPNSFSAHAMELDLADDSSAVRASVEYGPWNPWPVRPLSPGIMGWYRFVPRMETYHGVLSMDHEVSGFFEIDGERIGLDGGRGYAEKDWGRSFPSAWIWAQSNDFDTPGTSVMLSVAKIPWMTGAFVGNIAGLLLDGELHRFATYTGAEPRCVETGDNEARVILVDNSSELEITVHGCETLELKAPVLGSMEGKDAESLGGTIDVVLRKLRGGRADVVFRGTGVQAGIEVMNHNNELTMLGCDTPPE